MKISIVFFLSYCFMIGNVAFSQKVVPTSKLISNFQESGRNQVQCPMQVIEGFDVDAVVMNNDLLPASMYKLHTDFEKIKWSLSYAPSSNAPFERILTLVGIDGENGDQVMNELQEKYGKKSKGIPAVWYSGKINVLLCPLNLFGEIVSGQKVELTISKGVVVSQKNVVIRKGSLEKESKHTTFLLDGCWYEGIQYADLEPLERFVNQKVMQSSIDSFMVSFLLVTDNNGREVGYVLAPDHIGSNEEKTLVNNLLKRIGELPRWSFGWLETIDGVIFPGRYLKGIYSSDIGWRFEEYLH